MKIKGFQYLSHLFIIALFMTSCSQYNQVLKNDSVEDKYKAAQDYYNKGDYYHALGLFEDILPYYKGSSEMENIYYYYSFCYYYQGEYLMAAYNFKNYCTTYPNTFNSEECLFMAAKCYYQLSPDVELDQTDTQKAMNELQLFINSFPQSMRVPQANDMLDQLRMKLEVKGFNAAKLYFDIGNWKAASISFSNLLRNFPDSPDAEQCYFLILESDYKYASNSVDSKMETRLQDALKSYNHYTELFPNGIYLNEAKNISENIHKLLDKKSN